MVAQPFDRHTKLPVRGAMDEELGEFWVENPFQMPRMGHNLSCYERNAVFVNVGGRRFTDLAYASRADIDSDSRSAIAADFDRDGAQDVLVGNVGGGPLRLFRNVVPQGNHVRVELVGTRSERTGIGARVIAHVGNRRIVRDVFPANGFQGQGPAEVHIGTGDAERIDRLEVRWPSGAVSEVRDVPVRGRVTVTE